VVAPSPGELDVAKKLQGRAVEGQVQVAEHFDPGLLGFRDKCLVPHRVNLIFVAFVGLEQAIDTVE
jgi:hypothetical protein